MQTTKPVDAPGEAGRHAAKKEQQPAGPDERDAIIERLERTIAEERQNSAKLRATVDELRFKAEILEKSYAKQLADARARTGTAEQKLVDEQTKHATVDKDREETMRALKELRTDLARITAERDVLRKQQFTRNRAPPADAAQGPVHGEGSAAGEAQPESHAPEGTINELMSHPNWLRSSRQPAGDTHLDARVRTEDGPPPEEMISPELVFPKKKDGEKA